MLTVPNFIIMQSSLNMQLAIGLAVALVYCLVAQCAAAHQFAPRLPYRLATPGASGILDARDLVSRCTEKWHNTTLDHFNWARVSLDRFISAQFAQGLFVFCE